MPSNTSIHWTIVSKNMTTANNLFQTLNCRTGRILLVALFGLHCLPANSSLLAAATATSTDNQTLKYRLQIDATPRPVLQRVAATGCIPAGSRIIVYGKNLLPRQSSILAVKTGSGLSLKIIRWDNTRIMAYIAKSSHLRPDVHYYLGIKHSRNQRWLSNIIPGFRICGRKPTHPSSISPGFQITRPRDTDDLKPTEPRGGSTGNNSNNDQDAYENDEDHSDTDTNIETGNKTPGSGITGTLPQAPDTSQAIPFKNNKQQYLPDEIMLMSTSLNEAENLRRNLSGNGYKIKKRLVYKSLDMVVSIFKIPDGTTVPEAIKNLRRQYPKILIDANHIYRLHGQSTDKTLSLIKWGPVIPGCGKNLQIGLLDTEADVAHPAFRNRAIHSRSFVPSGSRTASKHHATAIASILIGNRNAGYNGIVPGARIYVAGVFEKISEKQTYTNSSLLMSGLRWLVSKKVDVINLSLGGPRNQLLEAILKKLMKRKIILVASAGNNGKNSPIVYPAAQTGVIAVTAINQRLKLYRHASQGDYIDFAAPGVYLKAAQANGSYQYVSGTSYAAPFVSAALGLLKKQGISFRHLNSHLQKHSKDLGQPGKDRQFGWGIIQMSGACQ